jgi:molecular chaperone GrpE
MNKPKSKSSKPKISTDLQKQVTDLTEALQRERADAENVRRRAEGERLQMANFYKAMILRELLPALDNLERSLKHVPKDLVDNDYVKGVQGVAKEFDKALEAIGLEKIKTVGEQFDPHLHEAISIEDEGGEIEVVCEELQSGYKLGDEIIRHALVKVKRSKEN